MLKAGAAATRPTLLLLGGALHGRLPVAVGVGLDLHPARLALRGLRDPHLDDAAVELRAHGLRVGALRQRERPREALERALHAVPALLVVLVLRRRSPEIVRTPSPT